MSYHHRTIRLSQLVRLRRLAAEGAHAARAAADANLPPDFVGYWARDHGLRFAPRQYRGTPQWLMPELARQAEAALRALLGRVA